MIRLVQLSRAGTRRVALVDEPSLVLLTKFSSVYALALTAIEQGVSLSGLVSSSVSSEKLDYDSVYYGTSEWQILSPIDHPDEPARCSVTGTGLTHLGSAKDRQSMHGPDEAAMTDSMRMFRWGVEKGRPAPGTIGIAPEWFYKGNGTIVRAHNEPLTVPAYAEDGGEEAELAGAYIVGPGGQAYRVGMCQGNEFSDHRFEKRNYLNLAGSKLRNCSLGPELIIDPQFQTVPGRTTITRNGENLWSKPIATGEAEMCHSLANMEHHHFKFDAHRRPGDVHVHYYGAACLSFGDNITLQQGDIMTVAFEGFGRPLLNPLIVAGSISEPTSVKLLV